MRFTWEIAFLVGDPRDPSQGAQYHPEVSSHSWFASPDNCAFDPEGRLWVTTDQGKEWRKTGIADGLFACDLEGEGAKMSKRFFRAPLGAEVCSPEFTPDGRTLFLSVQYPGAEGSSFDTPATRWPDFKANMPPRPAVLAIVKDDGGVIGSGCVI